MDYLAIAKDYKTQWMKDPEAFVMMVGKFSSVRGVLVQLYFLLVKEGKCEPISNLDQSVKKELWSEAQRISPVKDSNHLVEVVKALHGFGQFIQL